MRWQARILRLTLPLALLLTACTAPISRDSVHQTTQEQTTIRIAAFGPDTALDAIIRAYHSRYPQTRVEQIFINPPVTSAGVDPETPMKLLKLRLASGEVDLVNVPDKSELVSEKYLLQLDPFLQRSGLDLKPFGSSLDSLRQQGVLYDMPYALQTQVVLYNTDLFQAAGVPFPRTGWSWEDFRETAGRFAEPGDPWGVAIPMPESIVGDWLVQQTGDYWGKGDRESIRNALRFFGSLLADKAVAPPSQDGTWSAFRQSRAAMGIENSSDLHYLRKKLRFNWDVAPIPAREAGRSSTPANPITLAMAEGSQQPDSAWHFMQFAVGPEGAAAAAASGAIPLYRTSQVKEAWFRGQPAPPPGTEWFFETEWQFAARTLSAPDTPHRIPLHQTIREMFLHQLSWEDAWRDYQHQLDQHPKGGM